MMGHKLSLTFHNRHGGLAITNTGHMNLVRVNNKNCDSSSTFPRNIIIILFSFIVLSRLKYCADLCIRVTHDIVESILPGILLQCVVHLQESLLEANGIVFFYHDILIPYNQVYQMLVHKLSYSIAPVAVNDCEDMKRSIIDLLFSGPSFKLKLSHESVDVSNICRNATSY
jgi:hypothetical protein